MVVKMTMKEFKELSQSKLNALAKAGFEIEIKGSKGSKDSAPDDTNKDKDKVKGIEDFAPKKCCAYGQWKYAFHKFVASTVEGFTLSRDVRNGKVSYHLYYKDGKYAELPEYVAAKELWNKTYPYDQYVKTK